MIPDKVINVMMDDRPGEGSPARVHRGESSGSTVECRLGPTWDLNDWFRRGPPERKVANKCLPIFFPTGRDACIAEIDEEDAQYGEVGQRADEVIEPRRDKPVSIHLEHSVPTADLSKSTTHPWRFLPLALSTFAEPQRRAELPVSKASYIAESDISMASADVTERPRSIDRAWPDARHAPGLHGPNLENDHGMTDSMTQLVDGIKGWHVNNARFDQPNACRPPPAVVNHANGFCSSVSMNSRT